MGTLDKKVLQELQRQNQMLTELLAASAAPAPEEAETVTATPAPRLMTDYECMLICMSGDVPGAIDSWNAKARARRTARA